MKHLNIILLAVVLLALSMGQAHAQRTLSGMRGITLTTGMADGFYNKANSHDAGYVFGLSLSTYAKRGNQWVFGGEYLRRYYPYREVRVPLQQFTAEGGFYHNLLSDAGRTFFVSVGVSAMGGYETVNKGKALLYDGSTLHNKDGFIYGGAVSLQVEAFLSNRVALLLYSRERVLWGSSIGKFHTQYGIGLKIMID